MPQQEVLNDTFEQLASYFAVQKETIKIPYYINQDHVNRIITIQHPHQKPKVTIEIDNQNDLEYAKLFCNILNENL